MPFKTPDLETKELISYYEMKFGKGWDYGYILPTLSKIMQNAGRCIRSEKDSVIKRLWGRLQQRGLVEQRTVVIDRRQNTSVALVWLTERGRHFLHEQGLPFLALSEWDRLRLLHNSEQQPVHTAMVILAAYLFRHRNFFTEVCPPTVAPFAPDLLLTNASGGERIYVEVEAPSKAGEHNERASG